MQFLCVGSVPSADYPASQQGRTNRLDAEGLRQARRKPLILRPGRRVAWRRLSASPVECRDFASENKGNVPLPVKGSVCIFDKGRSISIGIIAMGGQFVPRFASRLP
jgi:hypothetical protein